VRPHHDGLASSPPQCRWGADAKEATRLGGLIAVPIAPIGSERWGQPLATTPLLRSIRVCVVVGVGIGAAIHGWFPEDALSSSGFAGSALAVPAATLAGVPMYAIV